MTEAHSCLRNGSLYKAERLFFGCRRLALQENRTDRWASATLGLARVAASRQDWARSLRYARKAEVAWTSMGDRNLAVPTADARATAGTALLRLGDTAAAEPLLASASRVLQDSLMCKQVAIHADWEWARALMRLGNYDAAVEPLLRAEQGLSRLEHCHPEHVGLLRRELTTAYERAGMLDQAIKLLRNHIDSAKFRDAYDWPAIMRYVRLLEKAGRREQAMQDFLALEAAYDVAEGEEPGEKKCDLDEYGREGLPIVAREVTPGSCRRLVKAVEAAFRELSVSDLSRWFSRVAEPFHVAGRWRELLPLHERIVSAQERLLGGDSGEVADGLSGLAWTCKEYGRFDLAEAHLARALEIQLDQARRDYYRVEEIYRALGIVMYDLGRCEEALEYFRRRLSYNQEQQLPTPRGGGLFWLARTYRALGRLPEAEDLQRQLLAMRESKYGPLDPLTASERIELGLTVLQLGRRKEAEQLFVESRRMFHVFGPGDAGSVRHEWRTWLDLGRLAIELELIDDAEQIISFSYESARRVLPRRCPHLALPLEELASVRERNGQGNEARALLEEALDLQKAGRTAQHPQVKRLQQRISRTMCGT